MLAPPPPPPVPVPEVVRFQLDAGRVLELAGLRHSECDGDAHGGPLCAAGHATGASQWPAGVLLCDYMRFELGAAALRGQRVAELGCGLGLCGLVAAALVGPTGSVLLTDGDAGCVAFCAANVASNMTAAADAPCTTRLLRWDDADAAAAAAAPQGFSLVLGGDLIYDGTGCRENLKQLIATVDALLSHAPDAQFLLGFQRRSVPLPFLLETAAARGLAASVCAGGYCEDLFANRTEELSDTWQQAVLRFTRAPLPVAAAAAAAVAAAAMAFET